MTLRFRRTGMALLACGVVMLAAFGSSPAAYWLSLPLSERFPAWQDSRAPDGIIVLGGAIDSEASRLHEALYEVLIIKFSIVSTQFEVDSRIFAI